MSSRRNGDLVALEAKPLLKQLGYRKKGWMWIHEGESLTRLFTVEFQRSLPMTVRRFKVQLDVWSLPMCNVVNRRTDGYFINSGFPSVSAASLAGLECDSWSFDDDEPVSAERRDSYLRTVEVGVEWLSSFSTLEDIFDWHVGAQSWMYAAVAARALGRSDAGYWLQKDYDRKKASEENRRLYQLRAEHWGIPDPT